VSENLETIKHVCETRWQSTDKDRAWSSKELNEMLSRLAQTSNAKVFILVDGLDECDPQDRLGDLADVILWLSRLSNVKLCVSCRPWAPFTKRFVNATVLHLDQLTYHDMEVYIEKRLLCAEDEADLCTDFHDGTFPAKQLIYHVANAANGVFLWVELVLNALCSGIRTGCSIEQLRLSTSQSPTDIDDYFQKLIFDRIGTTRPNVAKTAAALKLAMVLICYPIRRFDRLVHQIPMPDDYLNFWLLSVGQLKSGFSWTDQLESRYSGIDTEKKLRQTKAFLEETCKDLLVIQKHEQSYNVQFLHRTAFDFLCENAANLPIEKHAPGHFSDDGFAMDLLKLRCICRLREPDIDCTSSRVLLGQILLQQRVRPRDTTALENEIHQAWLLACESAVLETFRTRCNCLGVHHLDSKLVAEDCAVWGLHRCLLEIAQDMPHEALIQRDSNRYDYLWLALLELEKAGNRKATAISLLNQALWCGCDPDVSARQVSVRTGDLEIPCGQSKWQRWLQVEYLYFQQHSRAAKGDGAHQSTGAARDVGCQRMRENASIVELLLRHGANPNCTPCTADHQLEGTCSPTALRDVLQFIVPAECLSPLRTRLVACSSEARRYTLRHNQRKRAIRSYMISEQRFASRLIDRRPGDLPENLREDWTEWHCDYWRNQQRRFLQSLIVLRDPDIECATLGSNRFGISLFAWCMDCEGRSYACLSCIRPHFLTGDAPCTNISNFGIVQLHGHTTVAILINIISAEFGMWMCHFTPVDLASVNTAYQSLGCQPGELDLTPDAAISVVKKWYARNPIEPDSLQGDDFRNTALPEGLGVAALSIGGPDIDETSTSH
jgi:hypothetical protein